jgi:leucyl aminopeptidase (aminopeptidase T)
LAAAPGYPEAAVPGIPESAAAGVEQRERQQQAEAELHPPQEECNGRLFEQAVSDSYYAVDACLNRLMSTQAELEESKERLRVATVEMEETKAKFVFLDKTRHTNRLLADGYRQTTFEKYQRLYSKRNAIKETVKNVRKRYFAERRDLATAKMAFMQQESDILSKGNISRSCEKMPEEKFSVSMLTDDKSKAGMISMAGTEVDLKKTTVDLKMTKVDFKTLLGKGSARPAAAKNTRSPVLHDVSHLLKRDVWTSNNES